MDEDNSNNLLANVLIDIGERTSNLRNEVANQKYWREDAEKKLKDTQLKLEIEAMRLSNLIREKDLEIQELSRQLDEFIEQAVKYFANEA